MPTPAQTLDNLISTLRAVHEDNRVSQHFRQRDGDPTPYSTMYLAPFVFQFFIYNGLYQIDWESSLQTGAIVNHRHGTEEEQQDAFESFLRPRTTPQTFAQAFSALPHLALSGDWTAVVPDPRIAVEDGRLFFGRLRKFQEDVRRGTKHKALVEQGFQRIAELRPFIYAVRCNIFHGRKSLAEVADRSQNQRLQVYFLFLQGLVSLFFLTMSR